MIHNAVNKANTGMPHSDVLVCKNKKKKVLVLNTYLHFFPIGMFRNSLQIVFAVRSVSVVCILKGDVSSALWRLMRVYFRNGYTYDAQIWYTTPRYHAENEY